MPIGAFNRHYIFEEKKLDLFKGFVTVHAYIYETLVTTKNESADHLRSPEKVLQKLVEAELQVNAENPLFGLTETEYLGLWVRNDIIRPISSKVEDIKYIDARTKVIDVQRFLGLVYYYWYMWNKCTPLEMFSPLEEFLNGMNSIRITLWK